jgi:DNA-binding protein Fis
MIIVRVVHEHLAVCHAIAPNHRLDPGFAFGMQQLGDQLAKRLEAEGILTLHQVATEAKNRSPLQQALLQMLADLNGKQPSNVVRIAQDSEIRFQLHDGRMHHEGLRIGFPEIDPDLVVSSRGSIGMDQTLDLHVELPRLDPALRKEKGPAKCHITGTISNPKVAVQDGSLVLRQPDRKEPLIAISGVNLNLQVENTASGPVLAVEPVEVLKNQKLSLALAGGLLQLIDPDLKGSDREIAGEMSLAFKKLRIPLGGAKDQIAKGLEAEGTLTLHQVSTEAKNKGPMQLTLIKMLADLNGKQASEVLRLVQNAEIRFELRDGRMHQDGLRIGFPEIDPDLVVSSRGSIGMDETLDLRLELPRLREDKQRASGPIQCQITGTLSEPKIAIQGGSLVVNLAGGEKPALKVGNVNLNFSVEDSKDGRMLALAPVVLFEKQKFTPEIGDELLHLVAPTLGDLTGVHGEISLSLDKFRVPLGMPDKELAKRVELAGKLHLHQISASAKAPVLEALVKVMADMHGKRPSEIVRIIKDAEVRFEVREGRMHHEGLRLGLPDIAPDLVFTSRGSVGLDHSLDLVLEAPRISVPGKKNSADPKATAPVRLRVTGTIEKPVVTEIK